MNEAITRLLCCGRLLREAAHEETILQPLERIGLAYALTSCGDFPFIFAPDTSNKLADVMETMAAQMKAVQAIKGVLT